MVAIKEDKNKVLNNMIVKHLFLNRQLSSADLSDILGISLPTVTQAINRLIIQKRVKDAGFAASSGGRRPQVFELIEGSINVIAIGMDQLTTRIALFNEKNNIVGDIYKVDLKLAGNPDALAELINHIQLFIKERHLTAQTISGIGIGMPGFIDSKKGINHTFLKPEHGSLTKTIEEAIHIPVIIENDSSLIALAELKWGAAKNREQVMVLNIGWGIGLGIIVNGKLFRGHEGFAGEFSHIPLFENNKLCSCGKYGCLETETSLVVVAQKAMEGLTTGKPSVLKKNETESTEDFVKKIIEFAKRGDKFSVELLSESAYHIGRGVAILIHLLNPELIVISGIGSLAGKVWTAPVQQAINEHCIPQIAEHAEIKISTLGYNAELIGAAALVMDNYENLARRVKLTKLQTV